MKHFRILLAAAIVLSTSSFVASQERQDETGNQKVVVEKNPFLVEKRHGAAFTYSYKVQADSHEYAEERNLFLLDKRHNAVFMASNSINVNLTNTNLVADINPFLVDKRHGAVFMMNKNMTYVIEGRQRSEARNIFLEQKRHQ